uniref:BSD domain-containing protein n=1 Tax=Nelumbo nucifera TaxID=4432 RepID=A0A822Z934_NELNU|nr:TPA_asm: hypothetical protein HUJ06_015875 [Nelumbo nucifera]
MSWLARSLVNSLKVDEDDDEDKAKVTNNDRKKGQSPKVVEQLQHHQIESSENQGRGVKEDLTEITKTLTRQLWGVASFLAPSSSSSQSSAPSPPPPPPLPRRISSTDPFISDWNRSESSDRSLNCDDSDPARIAGIRSDFAEIGGKVKSGFSKLSNTRAVSEISKIASTFLPPFGTDGESMEKNSIGGAVGITDEVLAFAKNIAMHPETWLDFPLVDEEDLDDFDMSDAQLEHALAIERLAPRLAALRIELCPGHMSEGCFWMIYFVLLHSRLNKHDAELLSTPQIVEARSMWMQELQSRTRSEPEWSGWGISYKREQPRLYGLVHLRKPWIRNLKRMEMTG